jgi:glycosidase
MRLPINPLVHEIFTWVWLRDLSDDLGRPVTLADVPDDVWDDVARPGIDAVWLMGVWERSPAGARIAATDEAMLAGARAALPDLDDADIVGSAYCVRDYAVDPTLGGEEGLRTARAALADRGVGLVLDFVPNHVAPDHAWALTRPEYFVHGDRDELERSPDAFLDIEGHVIARGRDPYFPPWPEVLQLDTSRADGRAAAGGVLATIADRCDAVRCDMAMLMLDDVFARTWGARAAGPDDGRGYWPTVMAAARQEHPDVQLWAEAYWDLEPVLVQSGFDACYDKRLYDRLVHREAASSIRDHLRADVAYQAHTVRFTENHDEPRVASVLERAQARAATVVALTLPGIALLHEGQQTGRQVRVPVTLGRRPYEEPDGELAAWYDRLLDALATGMRRGEWRLLDVEGWPDNRSGENLVAWEWTGPGTWIVAVNLSGGRADGRLRSSGLGDGDVRLRDLLSGERYDRSGADIAANGLYVALDGSCCHLLQVEDAPS